MSQEFDPTHGGEEIRFTALGSGWLGLRDENGEIYTATPLDTRRTTKPIVKDENQAAQATQQADNILIDLSYGVLED